MTAEVRAWLRQLTDTHNAASDSRLLDDEAHYAREQARYELTVATPALVAALTAVLDLHEPDGAETPFCYECGHTYPCLTVRSVAAATDHTRSET